MSNKRKFYLLAAILLIAGLFAYDMRDSKQVYGNDKESIVKVIHSIEGYEDKFIEIVDITDKNDDRFVGFLSDNSPGFIQFKKNDDGNYQWRSAETKSQESFGVFSPDADRFMIVTNRKNPIAKMQVNVNGQEVEQEFTPHEASVSWVEFEHADNGSGSYAFRNYRYYDSEGKIIKNG